jgi:hypothetical protein
MPAGFLLGVSVIREAKREVKRREALPRYYLLL